jgi:hypothetical protein
MMTMMKMKLRILYASPHIIRTNKQQKVGWAGRVASKRQNKMRRCFHGKK